MYLAIRDLKLEILSRYHEDWVGLWFVLRQARRRHPELSDAQLKEVTLRVVGDLVRAGVVQCGSPTVEEQGFVPWASTPEESLDRVRGEWDALGRDPNMGDVVWLNTTPLAEVLLADMEIEPDA